MPRWIQRLLPKRGGELFSSEGFWVRLWTGFVAATLVLAALFEQSGLMLFAITGVALSISLREILRLANKPTWVDLGLVFLLGVLTWTASVLLSVPLALFLVGAILVAWISRASAPPQLAGLIGWLMVGICSGLWIHSSLRPFASSPASLLVLVLVPLWAGDTAAYLAGRIWGRTPLAPEISPGKTIEGALANTLVCVGLVFFLWPLCVRPAEGDIFAQVALGVVLAVTGQLGDLFQSRLKRLAGRKDSGSILPGHGGLLDRIDSFLLASPGAALTLWLFLGDRFT